tara:strand:+ start:373 stop:540 length:168 start_codon:yes stop_codon:yes gene_type:complete
VEATEQWFVAFVWLAQQSGECFAAQYEVIDRFLPVYNPEANILFIAKPLNCAQRC